MQKGKGEKVPALGVCCLYKIILRQELGQYWRMANKIQDFIDISFAVGNNALPKQYYKAFWEVPPNIESFPRIIV